MQENAKNFIMHIFDDFLSKTDKPTVFLQTQIKCKIEEKIVSKNPYSTNRAPTLIPRII